MTTPIGPPAVSASAVSSGGATALGRAARVLRVVMVVFVALLIVREAFYWIDTFRTGCSATPVVVRLSLATRALLYLGVLAGLWAVHRETAQWTKRSPLVVSLGFLLALCAAGFNFGAYVPWDMCRSAGIVEQGAFGLDRHVVQETFIGPDSDGPIGRCCTVLCYQDQTRAMHCEERTGR